MVTFVSKFYIAGYDEVCKYTVMLSWSCAIICSNTSIFYYSLIIASVRTPTITHNEYVMRSKLTKQCGILQFSIWFIVKIVGSVVKQQYLFQ